MSPDDTFDVDAESDGLSVTRGSRMDGFHAIAPRMVAAAPPVRSAPAASATP